MQNDQYPGQAADEQTLFVIYKHWTSVAPFFLVAIVVFILGLVAIYYGTLRSGQKLLDTLPASTLSVMGFFAVPLSLGLLLGTIWVWRHNRIVVTKRHVVDIAQIGIFNRKISILDCSRIQDMTTQKKGPLQTFLDYGSITVETAGEEQNFVFTYVPTPYTNEQLIHEVHRQFQIDTNDPDA